MDEKGGKGLHLRERSPGGLSRADIQTMPLREATKEVLEALDKPVLLFVDRAESATNMTWPSTSNSTEDLWARVERLVGNMSVLVRAKAYTARKRLLGKTNTISEFLKQIRSLEGEGARSLSIGQVIVPNQVGYELGAVHMAGYEERDLSMWLWCGPPGHMTSLHADRAWGGNIVTQIIGSRTWSLLPPEAWELIYLGAAPLPGEVPRGPILDLYSADEARYPRVREAREYAYHFELQQGEVLFYPGQWFHQVEYNDLAFAVNQWVGFNIQDYAKNHNLVLPSGSTSHFIIGLLLVLLLCALSAMLCAYQDRNASIPRAERVREQKGTKS